MKKIFIALATLMLLIAVVMSLTGYSLVIPLSHVNNDRHNTSLPRAEPGENLQPFSNYDFSKGNWTAYIIISTDDFNALNPLIEKRVCWKTNSKTLLTKMKKDWVFKYRENDDMATVNSSFYLVRDDVIVFESGIVLDKNTLGLQNSNYGWMQAAKSEAFVNICRDFKKVYWPIVFF
ncbi:hypothetical protein ACFFGT_30615 [Mucilaginibacter angelicae]|uniref:Uncharacterized protein n=1 Tax=Mucilaginibacter angelicae TaxID=869718 RepID=A0ABV6LGL2_9SPHI